MLSAGANRANAPTPTCQRGANGAIAPTLTGATVPTFSIKQSKYNKADKAISGQRQDEVISTKVSYCAIGSISTVLMLIKLSVQPPVDSDSD
jgi:hypothetical protein